MPKSEIYLMLERAVESGGTTDQIINAIHKEMRALDYVFYQP